MGSAMLSFRRTGYRSLGKIMRSDYFAPTSREKENWKNPYKSVNPCYPCSFRFLLDGSQSLKVSYLKTRRTRTHSVKNPRPHAIFSKKNTF